MDFGMYMFQMQPKKKNEIGQEKIKRISGKIYKRFL